MRRLVSAARRRFTRVPLQQVSLGSLRQDDPEVHARQIEPGSAIDCYYENHFLDKYGQDIRGQWLQLGDPALEGSAASLPGSTSESSPASEEGDHPADTFDCPILRQNLSSFFHLDEALEAFHRLLKPGGIMLATLPGIHPVNLAGKGYWSFTAKSASRLFVEVFSPEKVEVISYGNALAASAFVQNQPVDSLSTLELDHFDPCYPILIGVRAQK
jgi:hypothetical protein